EIYNAGGADLIWSDDWRFYDGSVHLVTISQGNGTVGAGEAFVIADKADKFLLHYPDFSGHLFDSVVELRNDGEEVKFSIDAGVNWSAHTYDVSLGAAGDGNSLSYNQNAWSASVSSPGMYQPETSSEEQCVCLPCAEDDEEETVVDMNEEEVEEETDEEENDQTVDEDDNTENEEEETIVLNLSLRITEILPDPDGDDGVGEFVEIHNYSHLPANLEGWILQDESQKKHIFSGTLAAGEYLSLPRSKTGLALNNSDGDTVYLLSPANEVIDQVSYTKAVAGKSYARQDTEWHWTEILTPGLVNDFSTVIVDEEPDTEDSATDDIIINDSETEDETVVQEEVKAVTSEFAVGIKNIVVGKKVKIRGAVSSLPGQFSKTYMYVLEVSDDNEVNTTAGFQLFSAKKDFPPLKLGELVEIVGTVSVANQEKRLKINTAEDIISYGKISLPPAEIFATGELTEDFVGALIQVEGELMKKQGSSWYLDDGSGQLRVYFAADIEKPDVDKGATIEVAGILNRTSSGLRLLPRYAADITVVQSKSPESSAGETTINVLDEGSRSVTEIKVDETSKPPTDFMGYGLGVVGLSVLSYVVKLRFF
ncbi:MAG: lamin tail domain-containing protein, partial [Candidatus Komeilibacteria bacterium]|nr:lamin tail domain-containing protein [Candidatus Komeilibacteria bacterium]